MRTELETLPSLAVLKTHGACVSRYFADYHIEKYLNRNWKELSDTEALKLKLLAYHLVVVHLFGSYTVYFEVNCLLLKETRKSQAYGGKLSYAKLLTEVLTWSTVKNICLTLQAPTPQNSQTHSNNSSAVADDSFECV